MIRHSLLAGFATLALLSAPAMAQNVTSLNNTAAGIGNLAKQNTFTMQQGSGPNYIDMSNTAAGIGNVAKQKGMVFQQTPSGPFGGTNAFNANNLAAGIGNVAKQKVFAIQK
ncbi:hypothetical protein [Azospirillum canadense]|uniref:hypothetical protein n=1 Tax=Azospirillum canadense TaxID=403962 RepID=UPI002226558F|nr:hypothetical protein [Azospirillum canadense]MCW2240969.1 hypothetical protein [Azospirillum canadense]